MLTCQVRLFCRPWCHGPSTSSALTPTSSCTSWWIPSSATTTRCQTACCCTTTRSFTSTWSGQCAETRAGRKVQDLRGRGRHRRHVLHFQVAKKQPDSQSRRHDSARGANLHAVPRDGASGGLRPPLHRGACETGGSISVSG